MAVFKVVLLNIAFAVAVYASCDENLVADLSFKLGGSNLAFPCSSTKKIYSSTGRYIQKNVIGTRLQIYKDNVFVALPRYKHGVPFTLASFSLKSKECHATLTPYPCWSIQEEGNCDALQSVVDLYLDQSETLWVLDVGVVNTMEQPIRRCPPKIVGINAKTGQVVKIIDLSPFVEANSRLQYIVIDFDKEDHAYAYVSDSGVGALIVYDIFKNKGYRVVLPRVVSDECLQKGVLYIAPIRREGETLLYFTYLSSHKIFFIHAKYLHQGQAARIVEVGTKQRGKEIVLLGTDNACGLFFRYKGKTDIYVWDTNVCFKPDNFVLVQKGGDCRLATHVVPGYKRLMWVLESNLHHYIENTVGCLGASIVVHPLVKTCDYSH